MVCNNSIMNIERVTCLDVLDTIDYIMDDGTVVFRTCEEERGKVVFQLVSAIARLLVNRYW